MILAKTLVFLQLFAVASSTNMLAKETRIINGVTADEDRYPYSVSLQAPFNGHFCGGALILNDVVLTAAHCLGGAIDVVINRHDFNDSDGELIYAKWQIEHPQYNINTDEYDIALIVLERPVRNAVPLIKLNDDNSFPFPGTIAHVMGWGDTNGNPNTNKPFPDEMQIVDLEIISNGQCENMAIGGDSYGKYGFGIFESNICTYAENKDACQGDSGGPLIVKGNDETTDTLVGITSWGIGCAYLPGVYSRVSKSYGWIQHKACQVSSDTSGSTLCATTFPTPSPTTPEPTLLPTNQPTPKPTTAEPTISFRPTSIPTASPSLRPSGKPSVSPSSRPTNSPTISFSPSSEPTLSSSPTTSSSPTISFAPTTRATLEKDIKDIRMGLTGGSISSEALESNSSVNLKRGICIASVFSFVTASLLLLET